MATIGDVAKEAGVSRSTVSTALSGKKHVSLETRAKIDAAIKKLNFTVNSGARALATSKTMVLGVDLGPAKRRVPHSLSSYVVALAEEAHAEGYRITLTAGEGDPDALREAIAARSIDGAILMDVIADDPRSELLRDSATPGVLIGMPPDTLGLDAVDLDYAEAGRMAVRHTALRQVRRAVLLCWPKHMYEEGSTYATNFLEGATEAAEAAGVELDVRKTSLDAAQIRHHAVRALEDDSVEALIVHNDAALPVLAEILARRPNSMKSVIGVAAEDVAAAYLLPFETICTHPTATIRAAISALIKRLQEGQDPPKKILLQPGVTPSFSNA